MEEKVVNVEQLENEVKELNEECKLLDINLMDKMIISNTAEIIMEASFLVPFLGVIAGACVRYGLSKEVTMDMIKSFLKLLLASGIGGLALGYFISNLYTIIKIGFDKTALAIYIDALDKDYSEKIKVLDDKEIELDEIKKRTLIPKKES